MNEFKESPLAAVERAVGKQREGRMASQEPVVEILVRDDGNSDQHCESEGGKKWELQPR